jgi:hypothetical protein
MPLPPPAPLPRSVVTAGPAHCRGRPGWRVEGHTVAPRGGATGHLIDLSIFFGGDGIRELLDEVIFGITKMVGPTDGLNPFY